MVEIEFLHESAMIIGILVSLGLSFYAFRLFYKFFKGGIFKGSIKAVGASTTFFAIALLIDMILDSFFGYEFIDAHTYHVVIEILFLIGLFYAVRRMYLAWRKLGPH